MGWLFAIHFFLRTHARFAVNLFKLAENKNLPQSAQHFIVPTFDTKVTEYLCSGGVFFLQTNFDFLTSHF